VKSVIVGTAGHVDHGKTVLVEALTGVNTDRWDEERERGITIDLGFAPFPSQIDGLEVSVIDVPGHEDFVKNMLAGATGVDVLLLVVAADEGPMPQTREHLWIARLLGVETGVVAITKSDLVDDDFLSLVAESVRDELTKIFPTGDWPVVPVSARLGDGIDELKTTVLDAASRTRARRDDDLFRMPVDRAFSIRGVGTVVTGTVWSGAVEAGEEVQILPAGRAARVRRARRDAHQKRAMARDPLFGCRTAPPRRLTLAAQVLAACAFPHRHRRDDGTRRLVRPKPARAWRPSTRPVPPGAARCGPRRRPLCRSFLLSRDHGRRWGGRPSLGDQTRAYR
jgi:selenocysteine-specific elongation factor SelB